MPIGIYNTYVNLDECKNFLYFCIEMMSSKYKVSLICGSMCRNVVSKCY